MSGELVVTGWDKVVVWWSALAGDGRGGFLLCVFGMRWEQVERIDSIGNE